MPPADPTIPTSILSILIIAITALAGVVVFLFKHYTARIEALMKESHLERVSWAVERARFEATIEKTRNETRAEYEAKHSAVLEDAREHEDVVRREYAKNIDSVAQQATEASAKLSLVLDKFYDRFVGPRRYERDKE